jgi:2-oxoglutarate ferredoxin oxidoreductase subunit alpha
MDKRFVIKIAGASGQGLNVIGEILAKAFKRSGFGVYAYREYPSLIKGGHATFQIDVSEHEISSSSSFVDLLVILNKQSTQWHLDELKPGAIVIHDIDNPRINHEEHKVIKKKDIKFAYIPSLNIVKESGGNELHANMATLGVIWHMLGLEGSILEGSLKNFFTKKANVIEKNTECLNIGLNYREVTQPSYKSRITRWNTDDLVTEVEQAEFHLTARDAKIFNLVPKENLTKNLLVSGNTALSLGAIHSGVRVYYSYPMTPSSSILTYLADRSNLTGMIVKQVEDEITAAAMAIGSNFMGTRALTGTSGGGFDLMTEHMSLAGMIEVPFVVVLGQRPGPATGMPTWTAQSDLMLSIFSGHGEFPRVVIAPKNVEDCFYSIQEAFNIAEEYQVPVVVLTDKLIAESLSSIPEFNYERIPLVRNIITDPAELALLTSKDRYKITKSGVSHRWLPGSKASDYDSNSDEHTEEGNVTEESVESAEMIAKRLRKESTISNMLPEEHVISNGIELDKRHKSEINILSWGSSGGVVEDAMKVYASYGIRVNSLNLKYLWPFRKEVVSSFIHRKNVILIEGNHNGQLGELIKMKTGLDITNKILKWDGRPFFVEEVIEKINKILHEELD